jgi:hypothetical protein
MTELASLVAQQWAEMSREEKREASASYRAAIAKLGAGKDRRGNTHTTPRSHMGGSVVDPVLERLVAESRLPARVHDAILALLGGASLRVAARTARVSYQTVANWAKRVLGESAAIVVDRMARERLLARCERLRRDTNSVGLRLSPLALAC